MAKYKVGQRVRIIWVNLPDNKHLIGVESHITSVTENVPWSDTSRYYGTDEPGYKLAVKICNEGRGYWTADQLEPILPDGASPSEYSYEELLEQLKEGVCELVGK